MVKTDGLLERCKVAEENPKELGFGEAALKMAELFRVDIHNPKYAPGSTVSLPVKFTLPPNAGGPPAPAAK
jgi:protein TonB